MPRSSTLLWESAYQLGWLIVPGVLVYRALSPRAGSILRQLAIGWALGYVLEILAFAATAAVGVRELLYAYPILVAAAAIPVIRRRAAEEDTTSERGRWEWGLAAVLLVAFAYLAVASFSQTPLPSTDHTTVYHPDHPFHVSIAAEAKHHWPLLDSQVFGEPRAYHVFSHIHLAAMSQVTGIDLPAVYFRLYSIPLIVLLALQMVVAARSLGRSPWVGVVAVALLFLVGEIDLDPRERYADTPFGGLFFAYLHDSPSFLLGLVFFVPAIVLLYELLAAERMRANAGQWALVALLLVGCGGAKVTTLPVLVGGLGLFVLWERIATGRLNRQALAGAGLAAAVMAGFYLVQYRGHSSGTSLDPLASTDSMLGVDLVESWLEGAPGLLGSTAVLDAGGSVVVLLALLAAPLIGIAWWLRRGNGLEVRHRWLFALFLSGLGGFLLIDINSAFFLFYGYVAGALLSAEGLTGFFSEASARPRPSSLAAFTVAWLLFVGLVIALPLVLWDPGGGLKNAGLFFSQDKTGTRDNGALYSGGTRASGSAWPRSPPWPEAAAGGSGASARRWRWWWPCWC